METILDRMIELPDGRILAYKIYGKPIGKPILFFHGFGSSAAAIDPDLDWLEQKNAYILAVQRPGYGNSYIKKGYMMSDFAHDIKYVIDRLGIDKVSVVGWSAGGLYSQVFAQMYPERVESISLVSSAIPFNNKQSSKVLPTNWKMIHMMNRLFPFLSKRFFNNLSNKINDQLDRTIEQSIKEMIESDRMIVNQPTIREKITHGAQEAYQHKGLAVYYDALAMTEKIDNTNHLTPFKVYIWQGDQDRIWTLKTSEYLRGRYQNAVLQIVEGQGHLLYLSHWNHIIDQAVCHS